MRNDRGQRHIQPEDCTRTYRVQQREGAMRISAPLPALSAP
jgi:hypothetical protein